MRSRLFAALLTVGLAALSGCATDTDTGADAGTSGTDATELASSPLADCEPLNVLQDGLNCVPEVGSARQVKARPTAPQGVSEFKVVAATAPYKADDRWVVAALSSFVRPSSGLSPARLGAQLDVFDVADSKLAHTVDLGEARVDGLVPVEGKDTIVAVLTDKKNLRSPVGSPGAPRPTTELTMIGVRASDGTVAWERNDVVTAAAAMPTRSPALPAYLVPVTAPGCTTTSNPATQALGIDPTSGTTTWSVDLGSLPGPRDNKKRCTADEVTAGVDSPVVEIVRAAAPGFYGDVNYNLRTNVLAATGEPLGQFRNSKITYTARDPFGPLALVSADDGANGAVTTYVIDADTGEVKATVDSRAIQAVGGKVRGIAEGLVYVENGKELFTLDAITGAETGARRTIPIRDVNGWTLHLDGTMTPRN